MIDLAINKNQNVPKSKIHASDNNGSNINDNFQVFFGMEFSLLLGAWKSKYQHLPVKLTNSTLIRQEISRQSLRIENV